MTRDLAARSSYEGDAPELAGGVITLDLSGRWMEHGIADLVRSISSSPMIILSRPTCRFSTTTTWLEPLLYEPPQPLVMSPHPGLSIPEWVFFSLHFSLNSHTPKVDPDNWNLSPDSVRFYVSIIPQPGRASCNVSSSHWSRWLPAALGAPSLTNQGDLVPGCYHPDGQ